MSASAARSDGDASHAPAKQHWKPPEGIDLVEQSFIGAGLQEEPPTHRPDEGEAPSAAAPSIPFVDFAVGSLGGGRWFTQKEPSTGETRSYRAAGMAGPAFSVELRPPILSSRLWWTLAADYWQALGLASWSRRENKSVGTTSSRLDAAARVHLKLGSTPAASEVRVDVGLGRWTFDVDLPPAPDLESPTGDYDFLRAGLEWRVPLRPFAVFAGGGVASAFHTGRLGDRVVSKKPWGADASLGASLSLGRHLDVRVFGAYTAFSYELLPVAGLRELPATVADRYATVGVTVHATF